MSYYNYFEKFPRVTHTDNLMLNLTAATRFTKWAVDASAVFYPYTVEEGVRPDQVAENYYGDARYSWIVLLSNKIVDPVYDWPLSQRQMEKYIVKKYGSAAAASDLILHYRTNWRTDDRIIDVGAYEAQASHLKRYWEPIVGFGDNVGSYKRKQLDIFVHNNRTVTLVLDNYVGFNIGDKVSQGTAKGIIASLDLWDSPLVSVSDEYRMVIEYIEGEWGPGAIVNESVESKPSQTVISANITASGLSDSEAVFYEPVYALDHEEIVNEEKRNIRILDKSYVDAIEKELTDLLRIR